MAAVARHVGGPLFEAPSPGERARGVARQQPQVADEQGVTATRVSGVTMRNTLARMGVRWRRAKGWITSPDPEYARKQARRDRLIRLAPQQPEWLLGFEDEVWWGRLAHPALHAWQDDDHPWRLIEQTVARDDSVTTEVTAEDDPAQQAAAAVALAVRTGSGVDMDVQPTDVAGRAATFRLTYHNHSPAPVAIALLAHDSEEGWRFRPEPAEPVVVPGDRAGSVVVHVVPKVRQLVGVPHAYTLVFRALPLWPVPQSHTELVREARFTYVPYVRLPALAGVPVWVRRLPVWTGALALVLLVLLLVVAGDRTLATATRTAGMRTPAPTRAVRAVQPTRPRVRPPRTGTPVATRTPPRAAAPAWSVVLLNSEHVDFGKQNVNTTGPVHTIHVVNASPAPLTVIDITTKGNAARDYAESNTCVGATIGAYKGCTISVRFTPRASGMRTANMVILDNRANGPQHVVLIGHGR